MTAENVSAITSADALGAIARAAPPGWPWRRGALLLVGAVQLITISAVLDRAGPVPVTWAALLLAIGPPPLAAGAVRLWGGQS